jgi:hypothetical protein
MNTTSPTNPTETESALTRGEPLIQVSIQVPACFVELFSVLYPRGNWIGQSLLREAISHALRLPLESVLSFGEINSCKFIILPGAIPAAQAAQIIAEILNRCSLEDYSVIGYYCPSEGFFREFARGYAAVEIGMITFETIREDIQRARKEFAVTTEKVLHTVARARCFMSQMSQPALPSTTPSTQLEP